MNSFANPPNLACLASLPNINLPTTAHMASPASPALSVRSNFSDMDDEELDLYLASCVPLSNLPTPPPAQHHPLPPSSAASLPSPASGPAAARRTPSPELQVYALQLASLVPRNLAGSKPSVAAIDGFLDRACLPVEMAAFAACVLDALSDGFANRWRDAFLPMDTNRLDFYLGTDCWQQPKTSSDLVVLAALALAHDFIDDRSRSNVHWALVEAGGRFSAKEVGTAKTCILEDINYGLFRITDDMVQHMVKKMQQPSYFVTPRPSMSFDDGEKEGRRPRLSLSLGMGSGSAVWAYGAQTPEPSP